MRYFTLFFLLLLLPLLSPADSGGEALCPNPAKTIQKDITGRIVPVNFRSSLLLPNDLFTGFRIRFEELTHGHIDTTSVRPDGWYICKVNFPEPDAMASDPLVYFRVTLLDPAGQPVGEYDFEATADEKKAIRNIKVSPDILYEYLPNRPGGTNPGINDTNSAEGAKQDWLKEKGVLEARIKKKDTLIEAKEAAVASLKADTTHLGSRLREAQQALQEAKERWAEMDSAKSALEQEKDRLNAEMDGMRGRVAWKECFCRKADFDNGKVVLHASLRDFAEKRKRLGIDNLQAHWTYFDRKNGVISEQLSMYSVEENRHRTGYSIVVRPPSSMEDSWGHLELVYKSGEEKVSLDKFVFGPRTHPCQEIPTSLYGFFPRKIPGNKFYYNDQPIRIEGGIHSIEVAPGTYRYRVRIKPGTRGVDRNAIIRISQDGELLKKTNSKFDDYDGTIFENEVQVGEKDRDRLFFEVRNTKTETHLVVTIYDASGEEEIAKGIVRFTAKEMLEADQDHVKAIFIDSQPEN